MRFGVLIAFYVVGRIVPNNRERVGCYGYELHSGIRPLAGNTTLVSVTWLFLEYLCLLGGILKGLNLTTLKP